MKSEIAVLAGGCFWGMEDILAKVPGVIDTTVGYTGGGTNPATYKEVSKGGTGHAESIEIEFDPAVLPFDELLKKWFFRMHDPTTKNQQGNDRGSQYRSAIFYKSEDQKETALDVIDELNDSGFWRAPIVTEVVEAVPFYSAEEYHQDYLRKNPGGYTCHYIR